MVMNNQLFPMGHIVATPGALQVATQIEMQRFLYRHCHGDWGIVCPEDAEENEFALVNGYRLFSAYKTSAGDMIWVITEADRSYTTILLPDEY